MKDDGKNLITSCRWIGDPEVHGQSLVYWTLNFGSENLQQFFQDSETPADSSVFEHLRSVKVGSHGLFTQEHFIIHHLGEAQYSIEDRNKPPLTHVNNKLVSKAVPLKPNDVIVVPIVHDGQDQSCYMQFDIMADDPSLTTIKQLFQCSQNGEKFIVYWEEDQKARKHFATHTEKVPKGTKPPAEGNSKNLRPASEVLCPYCGNLNVGYCPKCKIYICMGSNTDTMKCAGCGTKY